MIFVLLFAGLHVAAAVAADILNIDHAEFQPEGSDHWEAVKLPDNWIGRGLAGQGSGQYRLSFNLDQAPRLDSNWALAGTRLSTQHDIQLNGLTIASSAKGSSNRALARPMPTYIEIPPSLLRTGVNTLLIQEHCAIRCGLSALDVGSAAALLLAYESHVTLWITLPQLLNIATLALAGFMVFVWWRRPKESVIGYFGLLWIPMVLRCYSYFVSYTSVPQQVVQASFFAINAFTTALFALFSLNLVQKNRPRIQKLLWLVVGAAPVLAFVGALMDQIDLLRRLVYPFLIGISGYSFWIVWRGLRTSKSTVLLALWVAIFFAAIASIHDFLFIQGWFSLDQFFWMPWTAPTIFISFSAFLLNRMVHALDEAEENNVRLEHRVALRTSELRTANEAQNRFITAASHDLRQPLHTLGLLVGILKERIFRPDEHTVLLRIDSALQSLDALLHGILDVSRLDAQIDTPFVEAVSLAAVWENVGHMFYAEAVRLKLHLRLHPTKLWVAVDAHMLQRIVNNLVSNGLRYTQSGGVLLTARVRAELIMIEVWDSGIGIPEDRLDDVFHEFIQINNPEHDRTKGLGLGLAIVRRAAKTLGLRLEVKSRVGRGTVFRIWVPRVTVPLEAHRDPEAAGSPDVDGLFVMIVDDEQDSRFALQGLLTDWGCLVLTAGSGDEAVASLANRIRAPEALLLDYRLPGETGVQIAQRLQSTLDRETPVLMVTGDVAAESILEIRRSGFVSTHKPVNPAALRIWLAGVKTQLVDSELNT